MNISKSIWNEILTVLSEYKIPYTTHYESRDIESAIEYPDITVLDKHIQINLVIPDYFEDISRGDSKWQC